MPRDSGPGNDFVLEVSGGTEVWLTDARFADFSLEVTLDAGDAPELVIDTVDHRCRWPEARDERPLTLRAERSEASLVLSAGDRETSCAVPTTRLALGLRAQEHAIQLSRLVVHRSTH